MLRHLEQLLLYRLPSGYLDALDTSARLRMGVVRHRPPLGLRKLLEPGLFRNRTFSVANSAGFLSAIGLFGAIIYLPLYIQGVQGGSAAASSFVLTPLMGGLVLSSTLAGLPVTRTGRYKAYILSGLATTIVAFYLVSTVDTATPIWLTTAYTVLLGLSIGPTNSLFMLAVQNALPGDKLVVVTSANQFFRQIGGTVG